MIGKEDNGMLLKEELDYERYADWLPHLVFIEERKVAQANNIDLSDLIHGIESKVDREKPVSFIYVRDHDILKPVFEQLDCLDGVYDNKIDGGVEYLWEIPIRYDGGIHPNEIVVISKHMMWNKEKSCGCYAAKLIVGE